MQSKQHLDDQFLQSIRWIKCLRCFQSATRNNQMIILSCMDLFCEKCCKEVLTPCAPGMVKCYNCKNRVKYCSLSSPKLPQHIRDKVTEKKSNTLENIKFQNKHTDHVVSKMVTLTRNVKEKYEHERRKYEQIKKTYLRRRSKMKAANEHLLRRYTQEEIDELTSHPHEYLVKRFRYLIPRAKKPIKLTRRRFINEDSPVPLLKQVLQRSLSPAKSYSSGIGSKPSKSTYSNTHKMY